MKKLNLLLVLCLAHIIGVSQAIRLQENFNAAVLPTGWTNTAVSGTQTWSFGINGSVTQTGNNNLDGTAMAFFDDNNLGASSTNNTVTLTSPIFDNSNDISSTLEFDYNFREFAGPADRFYVEVYDGTTWNTVFSRLADDCGNWLGGCAGNFPHANIDISAHKNVNCQVRFTYHDGNDWCWYVGIDNVRVHTPISTSIKKRGNASTLHLSPNPNNGNFNLNVSNELVGKQYQVFDLKGGLVKQSRIDATNSQIELSSAKKGVYFMRIEGQSKAERIVVL